MTAEIVRIPLDRTPGGQKIKASSSSYFRIEELRDMWFGATERLQLIRAWVMSSRTTIRIEL
jgi:hypothetical protein